MGCSPNLERGFTLIELMVVVTIVGILAAIAVLSYRHFTDQAKAVEAEVALAEVHRLELGYYANNGSYTDNLNQLGFSMGPSLKYYSVQVRVHSGGAAFFASAIPLTRSPGQTGLLLSRTPDGQVGVTKADPITLAAQMGGASGAGGDSGLSPSGPEGASGTPAAKDAKLGCKSGGEATVAADGLLDMNFCFR
jgi:prepilin-type N-terminal cleavage/methylation domain-containing protein